MLKEIKYEARSIEEVILDLADEIKNGWRVCGFIFPNMRFSCRSTEITWEVTLSKES